MSCDTETAISVVISGSFRKHYDAICRAIKEFEGIDVRVVSPRHSKVINPGDDFAVLEADETTCAETLEQQHLNAIRQADALYLCNPGGYLGLASAMEVGWAIALGKPVFSQESCVDTSLRYFVAKPVDPSEVKRQLASGDAQGNALRFDNSSLPGLQSLVRHAVLARGFDDESPGDKILLMLEEFGELAKAIRKRVGLKIDQAREHEYAELREEMADILFYLLDLANTCDIDLLDAFLEKERKNAARQWSTEGPK
jgi:NTP pyrophosphatase (non-canonical NTP hydrolase)